jgi:hypothetical protein
MNRSIHPMGFLPKASRTESGFASGLIVWTSLSRLFLSGSVSTGARLRFTGRFPFSGDRPKPSTTTNRWVGNFRPAKQGIFNRR